MPTSQYETECFFLAPIGEADSDARVRSDGVLNFIVRPAAAAAGLSALRADELGEPGQITLQVIDHVVNARAAVADLTGANANVYYELAIRHAFQKPTVLIAEVDTPLPFDIAQMRTIFFRHNSLQSAADAQEEIKRHLKRGLEGAVDSPVATVMNVNRLIGGDTSEQTLAQLVGSVESMSAHIHRLERRVANFDPQKAAESRGSTPDARIDWNTHEASHALNTQLKRFLTPDEYNRFVTGLSERYASADLDHLLTELGKEYGTVSPTELWHRIIADLWGIDTQQSPPAQESSPVAHRTLTTE